MAEEKEVIVTSDSGGGGAGMIIAVVLLIAVLVGLFLLYQNGVFSSRDVDVNADVKIETPKTN